MFEPATAIIDCGSAFSKAGLSTDDAPTSCFRTIVGKPRANQKLPLTDIKDYYIGSEAQEKRNILAIKYPVECGFVTNWDDLQKIWTYIYTNQLCVEPEEHPAMLIEGLNPKLNREKLCQLMFEEFNVPALHLGLESTLALLASGRRTGIVVELGEGVTEVVPVYESLALRYAVNKSGFAGRDIFEIFIQSIMQRTSEEEEPILNTRAQIEQLYPVFHEHCFVWNPDHSDTQSNNESQSNTSANYYEKCASVEYEAQQGLLRTFHLDDKELQLGRERFLPHELLFDPSLVQREGCSLAYLLKLSLGRCDPSIREELYRNVVLTGGYSKAPGLAKRLEYELGQDKTPVYSYKGDIEPKVNQHPDGEMAAWMGGKILANSPSFKDVLMSKADYDENGPSFTHRFFI